MLDCLKSLLCTMRAPEETVSPQVTHIGAIAKMDPVFTHTTLAPFQEHNGRNPSSTQVDCFFYKHSNGHHFLSHLILLRMIGVGVEWVFVSGCWWLLWVIVRLPCWFSAWCFLSQQFRISFLLLLSESSWISFSVETANNLDERSELLSRPQHKWNNCSWI